MNIGESQFGQSLQQLGHVPRFALAVNTNLHANVLGAAVGFGHQLLHAIGDRIQWQLLPANNQMTGLIDIDRNRGAGRIRIATGNLRQWQRNVSSPGDLGDGHEKDDQQEHDINHRRDVERK